MRGLRESVGSRVCVCAMRVLSFSFSLLTHPCCFWSKKTCTVQTDMATDSLTTNTAQWNQYSRLHSQHNTCFPTNTMLQSTNMPLDCSAQPPVSMERRQEIQAWAMPVCVCVCVCMCVCVCERLHVAVACIVCLLLGMRSY